MMHPDIPAASVPPFTVLHICMGNICRSPMAERLLTLAVTEAVGSAPDHAGTLVHSHSAGTGGWHEGEPMNPPAARQVRSRGGDDTGFAARKVRGDHLDSADLVLCATGEQQSHLTDLCPDAAGRIFVLGHAGRLLVRVDPASLPPAAPTPEAVSKRGGALVAALDALRDGEPLRAPDDLVDPYGGSERTFARIADQIERTLRPLAAALVGRPGRP
jgi:protein-tyrosine phosphatase